MRIHAAALVFAMASLLLRGEDAKVQGYWIRVDPVQLGDETLKKMQSPDYKGSRNWGLRIQGAEEFQCVVGGDGGTGFLEVPADVSVDARLVETNNFTREDLKNDPAWAHGMDICHAPCHDISERVAFSLAQGKQTLTFADGTRAVVTVEAFDPDAKSGAKATLAGASAAPFEKLLGGELSFDAQQRTECWAIQIDKRSWVEGFVWVRDGVCRVDWIDAERRGQRVRSFDNSHPSADPPAFPEPYLPSKANDGGNPPPPPVDPRGERMNGYHVFRGFLDPGRYVVRVRVGLPWHVKYHLYFAKGELMTGAKSARAAFVRGLLELAATGEHEPAKEYTGAATVEKEISEALSSHEAQEALVAGLSHANGRARALAAYLVGTARLEAAEPRLRAMSRDDPSQEVREAARRVLAEWYPDHK